MCGDTRVEGEQNLTTKTKLYRFDYDPWFFLKIFFFFFQEKDFTVARVLWFFFSSRAPGDPRKEKKETHETKHENVNKSKWMYNSSVNII